jgi:hypothetical protein
MTEHEGYESSPEHKAIVKGILYPDIPGLMSSGEVDIFKKYQASFSTESDPELGPEEEARIQRDFDSIYTGFHVDPGKHDRYLPREERQGPREGTRE